VTGIDMKKLRMLATASLKGVSAARAEAAP
jgi:hypothetical protein